MEGWKRHDDFYLVKQEQIAPGAWLLMLYNHTDDEAYPAGWVNIMSERWPGGRPKDITIREKSIPHPASILEIECIGMEWTKEVLDGNLRSAGNM